MASFASDDPVPGSLPRPEGELTSEEPATAEEDDAFDGGDLYNLFVCEDYVVKTWQFGDLEMPLKCSNMSTTQYDLTGQIVWPACVLLSWYIYAQRETFKDAVVLELGAGCGLSGFVAAKYCRHSTVTDGNEIVTSLLRQNKDFLSADNVTVEKLLWGIKSEVERSVASKDRTSSSSSSRYPDFIIGADVILWPNMILPLLYTIRWLLAYKRGQSKCIISYVVRAHSTTKLLYTTASRMGLDVQSAAVENFLPLDCTDFNSLEKCLLIISIDPSVSELELQRDVSSEIEEVNAVSAMPC
ncbi:hypothetical protein B484DRAFT_457828 [Ochromonadaceae sp. CCMP2298]|nr:hypothetical protein B484DRAFT_457828 [Ochromonadaceae sp. CCMP2298]|mmetsp:Transcript_4387/g.9862  ORF Transcript_4387/g.9862 Transcript_4387/m.9862 type:complete len:299 (+) Transcript_4387:72-968(+)